jgi:hypothetical protein
VKTIDIVYHYTAENISTRPLPSDSNAALIRLNNGNRDFAALLDHVSDDTGIIQQIIPVDPRDLGLASDGAGPIKQRPFAAVLGCSDARVPIELVFNEGPNDLFVVRVAGNGLGMTFSSTRALIWTSLPNIRLGIFSIARFSSCRPPPTSWPPYSALTRRSARDTGER